MLYKSDEDATIDFQIKQLQNDDYRKKSYSDNPIFLFYISGSQYKKDYTYLKVMLHNVYLARHVLLSKVFTLVCF